MKTGAFKELAPYDPDWYYVRSGKPRLPSASFPALGSSSCSSYHCWPHMYASALNGHGGQTSFIIQQHLPCAKRCVPRACFAAAIARKLYMRDGMGVGLFRNKFGGSFKRRGVVPEKFAKASGETVALQVVQPSSCTMMHAWVARTARHGRQPIPSGRRAWITRHGRRCSSTEAGWRARQARCSCSGGCCLGDRTACSYTPLWSGHAQRVQMMGFSL